MRNWFTMKKAEAEGDKPAEAEIMIYDAIGKSFWDENAVSASSFIAALAELGDVSNIKLRINSPGGDVFDGVAIYNAIKNHKATVTAHVDGLAASAASLIAMAANRIVMPSNAFMLVHQASGIVMGTADDMIALAGDLERIDTSMVATYAARTGQTHAKVKSLMKEDRLMDAKEAKELGYTDEVSAPVKMAASYSLRLLPKAAADRFRAVTGTAQGDPPQTAPASGGSGEQPNVPPAPPAPPQEHPHEPAEQPPVTRPTPSEPSPTPGTSRNENVVDLNAARQQGLEEHRRYVADVTDLCTLARAPERVGAYVRANTPVQQVRNELLAMQTAEPAVMPHHPLAPQTPPASAWAKITDKLNARSTK